MKNSVLLLLALTLFLASACNNDDDSVDLPTADLAYDGAPQTAPFLPAGEHELAARFPASITSGFQGQFLSEIQFYLVNVPTFCEVRIYGENTGDTPGDLLYSADVSGGIGPNGWNIHPIIGDFEITGEDLWLTLRIQHSSETNSVGCDAGPANPNGDWIFYTGANNWESFRQRSNGEANINWNIRGIVE